MTAVNLLFPAIPNFQGLNGLPLVNGQLNTYAAGTSTQVATYADAGGLTPLTNPIILNSYGAPSTATGASSEVWGIAGQAYKLVLTDAALGVIWTADNVMAPITMASLLAITNNVVPTSDNTYTLGTSSASWANAYLGSNHAPVLGASGNVGYYKQTAAEAAVPLVPTDFSWPPYVPLRYGAIGDGVTNDAVAVQAAFNAAGKAGGEVYFPPGYIFLCNADITVPTASTFGGPCASMRGQGWPNWSVNFSTGSTFGFVYLGGGATTGGVTTSNYYYAGPVFNVGVKMTGTSNTAFFCNSVNQPQLSKVWVAGTSGQGRGAYFLNCLLPSFADCLVTGMGSATQWSVEFDQCTSASWRGSRISGGVVTKGGLAIDRCTNWTGNAIAIESCGTPISIGAKSETTLACTGITMDGLELENPGNNPYIDIGQGLSSSALVLNVHIRGMYGSPSGTTTVPYAVRFRATSGIVIESPHFTLGSTPTSCYEMPDTSCSGVTIRAARNLQSLGVPWVRYNATQVFSAGPQYDWWLGKTRNSFPICQVDGLKDWFNTNIGGTATPDIRISTAMGGYFSAVSCTNGGATTITSLAGGELGMHLYILAADSNTTLTFGNSGGAFRMRSGANVTMSAAKIYEFVNDGASGGAGGSCWVQIGDN